MFTLLHLCPFHPFHSHQLLMLSTRSERADGMGVSLTSVAPVWHAKPAVHRRRGFPITTVPWSPRKALGSAFTFIPE